MIFLETERLRLVSCPAETGHDELARCLGVRVPAEWPLELADLLPAYSAELRADAELEGWGPWLMVAKDEETLVGDLGFTGRPDAEGAVEIGYSVLPPWRRRGYATEAVRELLTWVLERPGVTHVVAGCEPGNGGSIGVLEKVGMKLVGESESILSWELRP